MAGIFWADFQHITGNGLRENDFLEPYLATGLLPLEPGPVAEQHQHRKNAKANTSEPYEVGEPTDKRRVSNHVPGFAPAAER